MNTMYCEVARVAPLLQQPTSNPRLCCLSPLRRFVAAGRALAVVVALLCAASACAGSPASATTKILTAGYSMTVLSNIDHRDASLALRVWFEHILKKERPDLTPEPTCFENWPAMREAILADKLDVFVTSPLEYLDLREAMDYRAWLTSDVQGTPFDTFIVVVRKNSGLRTFADLRGKRLIVDNRLTGEIPYLWLDCVLWRGGFPGCAEHFTRVKEVKNPSEAVLPVFFKQADAAVVRLGGYETVTELNPQVGSELEIIARSPAFLRGVLCFRHNLEPGLRDFLFREAQRLRTTPKGQQVLTLFKIDQMIPFKAEYLATTEELRREHAKLKQARSSNP